MSEISDSHGPNTIETRISNQLASEAAEFLRNPKAPKYKVTKGDKEAAKAETEQDTEIESSRYISPLTFPTKFDHFSAHYHSLFTDTFLDEERESFTADNVSFFNLQQFVHQEMTELEIQQKQYEEEHPEWLQQKTIVELAVDYFSIFPDRDAVSVAVDPDGKLSTSDPGKNVSDLYRTFHRETIDDDNAEAHQFEMQREYLKIIDDAAIDMAVGNMIDDDTKVLIENYLGTKMLRALIQARHSTGPSEENARGEKNFNFFYAVAKNVRGYESVTAANDIKNIQNYANSHKTDPSSEKLVPIINKAKAEEEQLVKETERFLQENAPKPKTSKRTRLRGQKPHKRRTEN